MVAELEGRDRGSTGSSLCRYAGTRRVVEGPGLGVFRMLNGRSIIGEVRDCGTSSSLSLLRLITSSTRGRFDGAGPGVFGGLGASSFFGELCGRGKSSSSLSLLRIMTSSSRGCVVGRKAVSCDTASWLEVLFSPMLINGVFGVVSRSSQGVIGEYCGRACVTSLGISGVIGE